MEKEKLTNFIEWVFVEGGPRGDFYIASTPVTFDQFDAFCDESGYAKPKDLFGRGKHPVIHVNVADAVAFCDWLSKESGTMVRLPEADEWEFAARGGKQSKNYEFSGSNSIDEVAWYLENSGHRTHEVATKKPNELGIYDMSGNVYEWCGKSGLIRGGSWNATSVTSCRISFRLASNPGYRYFGLGFRPLQKR
jgi:formylglycine-generating enzyme